MSDRQLLVKQLFIAAAEIESDGQRLAYLVEQCGPDENLRGEVMDLLAHDQQAEGFLQPEVAILDALDAMDVSPQTKTIGPYKLLEILGEGGMGVVFAAEQTEPVRRRVALKIIKPGMDTKEVLARFDAERQALAMMSHPNISKILDLGTTDDGRPYFVMELVKGVSITQFCDQQQLDMRKRLKLFVTVCQAVQHAHMKGIIHRDLKPSNILVELHDVLAVPKVIDFGVAKATDQRLTNQTLYTRFSQLVGTPIYMSPEQAELSGLDVDTRSDVFSLGVLLYELITSRTPFDKATLAKASFDEMRRIIREDAPPKPSDRLSTLSAADLSTISDSRGLDPRRIGQSLKGELDWIVMRAMEKDRSQRYESASSLAADIERYLNDQPVEASPPNPINQMRKFARRNKALLGTISLVAASLVLGIIGTTWQAILADGAAREAVIERDRANESKQLALDAAEIAKTQTAIAVAVNAFLNDDLLSQANPENQPDPAVSLRTVIDRAAKSIEGPFGDQPTVEAAIRHTLAKTYQSLGIYADAQTHATRALQVRTEYLGADDVSTLQTKLLYAEILGQQGDNRNAHQQLDALLNQTRRVLGPEAPLTLEVMHSLAGQMEEDGENAEAEALSRQTWEIRRRVLGDEHTQTLASMDCLANVLRELGRLSEAEKLHQQTLDVRRRVLGAEHQLTVGSMNNLAIVYSAQARFNESEKLKLQVLEIRRRTLDAEHPNTLTAIRNLATVYDYQGRYVEAEKLYLEILEVQRRKLGEEHPSTLATLSNLAIVYLELQRYDAAEELKTRVLEIRRRDLGNDHPDTLTSMHNLAVLYRSQRRSAEAQKLALEVLEISRRTLGDEHPLVIMRLDSVANGYRGLRDYAQAEEIAREALEISRRKLGAEHTQTLLIMQNLGNIFRDQQRHGEAEAFYRPILEIQRRVLGTEHPDTRNTMKNLAKVDQALGHFGEAEEVLESLLDINQRILGDEHPSTLSTMSKLATAYHSQARFSEAEAMNRKTLELYRQVLGEEHPNTLNTMTNLASAVWRLQRHDEAEELFLQAVEICQRTLGDEHPQTKWIMTSLAKFRGSWSWRLATARDTSARNSQQAVELARHAVKFLGRARDWNNLGVALYRNMEFQEAVAALEKADSMIRIDVPEGDRNHRFFLAMACWQAGDKESADDYYFEGITAPSNASLQPGEEQYRFRAEAEQLMGLSSSDDKRRQRIDERMAQPSLPR